MAQYVANDPLALREPNENTLAQAEWLSENMGLAVSHPEKAVLADYEAQARAHFKDGEYHAALARAEAWYRFQPFTSRPAVLASYISGVCLEDHISAIRILEMARKSSPHDVMLLNNLAFSYASLDKVDEASNSLSAVHGNDLNEQERYTLMATCGLIKFRSGSAAEAREHYEHAMVGFRRICNNRALAVAAIFLAREEARLRSNLAGEAANKALWLAEKSGARELLDLASRLSREGP